MDAEREKAPGVCYVRGFVANEVRAYSLFFAVESALAFDDFLAFLDFVLAVLLDASAFGAAAMLDADFACDFFALDFFAEAVVSGFAC